MVLITVEMVRRKSEHNEKEISTLEELALHQENIEKIDKLQNWCRNLEILLLQSNVIGKIENLGKLKRLKYLNLALNNIERIENLEGLESLEKLDLTLNFIGDLKSVSSLKENVHLKCLILTGNPCTDFRDYRDYTLNELPQVTELDGTDVSRSSRILALQDRVSKARRVEEDEKEYFQLREAERADGSGVQDSEDFWNQPSKNTPEERIRISEESHKIRQKDQGKDKEAKKKREIRLFDHKGRPLNVNQPKLPFKLYDDDEGNKILDIAVYRYLDTSHLDVDVQPKFVTVRVKDKVMQLTFDEEVAVNESVCRRSQTTGHLQIRMPIVGAVIRQREGNSSQQLEFDLKNQGTAKEDRKVDIRSIVEHNQDWEDNADVPPLE